MEDIKQNISYTLRQVNSDRLDAILKYAGQSILDVGCGSGAYVLKLAGRYDISGVDYQAFDTWHQMPHLFRLSDASELSDFDDNSVDTILSFETLEHLQDPEKALREYYRVCRKNVILTVPNCEITNGMKQSSMTYYHYIDRTHINFFKRETIVNTVIQTGFKVDHDYYINQISLMPLLNESFDLEGLVGKIIRKLILRKQKKKYYITSLVVGNKG